MSATKDEVIIYTDGGAQPNPGIGGYGVVMLMGEHRKELSGGEADTTNNRMELTAAIIGLETLTRSCDVKLYSDSKYVVDSIEKGWLAGWQKKNWKKSDNKPVENQDLWERILPLLERHDVELHWVKGHAGIPENERCDELANESIESLRQMQLSLSR